MSVKIIYFVHGTTTDNEEHKSTGQNPGVLSKLGINQSKELITSLSINNLEDLDEKLDIKLPYSLNNNITNSLINTQESKNPNFNIRAKMVTNKVKGKKLNMMPVKLKENRNNNNESLKEYLFNTFNKLNLMSKVSSYLQNFNDKNKYIQNKKKENKNINTIFNKKNAVFHSFYKHP